MMPAVNQMTSRSSSAVRFQLNDIGTASLRLALPFTEGLHQERKPMKRLLMITSAIGLCLAAPAFAQLTTEQDQQNRQRATPPSSSAPAAQSQDRQRQNQDRSNQGGQAQQQPPANSPSPSAQAPADRNQSGQAQNQRQPASGGTNAQAPTDQQRSATDRNQPAPSGQAQNQRAPAGNTNNAQAPADQQRSATDRNQPNAPTSAQAPNDRQRAGTDRNQRPSTDRAQTRQSDQRQDARTSRDRSSKSATVNINETQRTRIAAAFSSVNVRPVNVNFNVAVGVAVPRTVALRTVPSSIVTIAPQFRGYSYFATSEQIVIVEPRRKTVVAVLPAGGTARAQAPASSRVSFSEEQREVIRKRASTLRSTATTGSASRIVVEEEVPATIELEEFPAEIVTEVPAVRTYRYFRQDNDVVVVDPGRRRVIEVIR